MAVAGGVRSQQPPGCGCWPSTTAARVPPRLRRRGKFGRNRFDGSAPAIGRTVGKVGGNPGEQRVTVRPIEGLEGGFDLILEIGLAQDPLADLVFEPVLELRLKLVIDRVDGRNHLAQRGREYLVEPRDKLWGSH